MQMEIQYSISCYSKFNIVCQLAMQYANGYSIFDLTVQFEKSFYYLQFNIQIDLTVIDWITEWQIE